MIDRIRGRLVAKPPASAVIEIGGISFWVDVPLTTWEHLGAIGSEASLFTYLHVREDLLQLYGFLTVADRDAFLELIAVSGIGPRSALTILSRFAPNELAGVVADRDVRRMKSIPGIGQRMAERLVIELQGKLGLTKAGVGLAGVGLSSTASDAVRALETLGYRLEEADIAIRKAQKAIGADAPVEDLVRKALKGER